MDEAVHDLIKVYLAQIQSAIKISKIICEHGNREELTGDDIICGLVYRLMTPMPEDEIVEALNTAENFLNDEESDLYFSSRPRKSQLGAWASKQSSVIQSRKVLTSRFKKYEKKFEKMDVKRPPYWVGIKIVPKTFEFWQGDKFRLHEREVYYLRKKVWQKKILSP